MNTLPTHAQARTWMGLTRQQLVGALMLLVLLAVMAFALLGAAYRVSGTTASTESSSLMASYGPCNRCV